MTLLFAAGVIQFGCFIICCSMSKHFRMLYPNRRYTQVKRWSLLLAGYVCLAIGLGLCLREDSLAIALTTFSGLITVTISLVALLLGIKRIA